MADNVQPGSGSSGFADHDDFVRFYRRTAGALHKYVRRIVGEASAADDVVQIAYLRMLDAAPMEDRHRRAYLYRAAGTIAIDRWRRERRRQELDPELVPDESAWIGLETKSELDRLASGLSHRDYSLLWLAYAEGFAHDEIATIMGIGQKSVRVLLSRARERARARLESNDGDDAT
jgi:RNA polymerase sigma factor (sigma-70 family)